MRLASDPHIAVVAFFCSSASAVDVQVLLRDFFSFHYRSGPRLVHLWQLRIPSAAAIYISVPVIRRDFSILNRQGGIVFGQRLLLRQRLHTTVITRWLYTPQRPRRLLLLLPKLHIQQVEFLTPFCDQSVQFNQPNDFLLPFRVILLLDYAQLRVQVI